MKEVLGLDVRGLLAVHGVVLADVVFLGDLGAFEGGEGAILVLHEDGDGRRQGQLEVSLLLRDGDFELAC